MKRTLLFLSLAVLLLTTTALPGEAAPLLYASSTVSAGSGSVNVGSSVTIQVSANIPADSKLGAATVEISYDSSLINATGCSVTGFDFGLCNPSAGAGLVSFNLGSLSGVSGGLTLASITFTGVAPGTSSLSVNVLAFADPEGNDLAVSASNGSITVNGAPATNTTAPTRTPTSTRTPGPTRTPTSTATTGPTKTQTATLLPGQPTFTRTATSQFSSTPVTAKTNTPGPTTQIATPPAMSFYADDPVLQAGSCTYLRWSVSSAVAVYLDGAAVYLSGAQQVCPKTSEMHTLYVVAAKEYVLTQSLVVVDQAPTDEPAPEPTAKPKNKKTRTPTAQPPAVDANDLKTFAMLAVDQFSKILPADGAKNLLSEVSAGGSALNCQDEVCIAQVLAQRVAGYNRDVPQILSALKGLWNAPGVEVFGPRWPWAYALVREFAVLDVNMNLQGVLSPVNLMVVNQAGQRTGRLNDNILLEEIPGSFYALDGESKFVFYPADDRATTYFQGVQDGTMTVMAINSASPEGDILTYLNVPVSPAFSAQLDLFDPGWTIKADESGDTVMDREISPTQRKPIRTGSVQQPTSAPAQPGEGTPAPAANPISACKGALGVALLPLVMVFSQWKRRKTV